MTAPEEPQATPGDESGAREFLERFAPLLRFDSIEHLRPTRIDDYVAGSQVIDDDGLAVREAGGAPGELATTDPRSWRLNPLPGPENLNSDVRTAELLARYGLDQSLAEAGTSYGRVVTDGEVLYLQYWYFYVDNPCVISFGRHDGDWEFAQVRVVRHGDGYRPTHLTLDQHGKPESRRLPVGVEQPTVFVAVGSHASYFRAGTNPQFPLSDECDAKRAPSSSPEVLLIPPGPDEAWPHWPGRWGMDRGPGTRLWLFARGHLLSVIVRFLNHRVQAGDSPASPACQETSWSARSCYRRGLVHHHVGGPLRALAHFLGRSTWPRVAPAVWSESDAGGLRVSMRPVGLGLRRVSRVAIAFEEPETLQPLATATLDAHRRSALVELPAAGAVRWRAAGYNSLRQRGEVSGPFEIGSGHGMPDAIRGSAPGELPLTEGDGTGLVLGDVHWSPDRHQARRARATFNAILATDLQRRGSATVEQLYQRLSWFYLPFDRKEIGQLIESAQRGGYIERETDAVDSRGRQVSDRWGLTEKGEKLKRPRALSLPDLGQGAFGNRAGYSTVFGSVKGMLLAVVPYLALTGLNIKEKQLPLVGELAGVLAGLIVLATVLATGIRGDLRLRAAALSWPRLKEKRNARFRFQLSYMRMAFLPALLVSVYLVGAVVIFSRPAAALLGVGLSIGLFVWALWMWPLRQAWSGPGKDVVQWKWEWRRRERERPGYRPG